MIRRSDLEGYIDEFVIIGVPHLTEENRLFYYQGILKDLDDNFLTLATRDGIEVLSLDDIRHFRVSSGRNE